MSKLADQVRKALQEPKDLVQLAQTQAAQLAKKGVKSTQLRKLFHEVRGIEADWLQAQDDEAKRKQALHRLMLFKPKLAYQAARHPNLKALRAVLEPAIDEVYEHPELFPRFVDLFEALVAYYYASNPKN